MAVLMSLARPRLRGSDQHPTPPPDLQFNSFKGKACLQAVSRNAGMWGNIWLGPPHKHAHHSLQPVWKRQADLSYTSMHPVLQCLHQSLSKLLIVTHADWLQIMLDFCPEPQSTSGFHGFIFCHIRPLEA